MGLLINRDKMGKSCINGVKHNAYIGGQKIWNDVPLEPFSITVQDNGSFNIPTRGVNGDSTTYQSYNWKIDWGDGNTEIVSGTGTSSSTIPHTYTDGKNIHEIIIKPNGTATQGWLNAFGCGSSSSDGPKIKSINSPIPELMRTMALYSHSDMFYGCTGLTSIPENLLPATTLASYCYRNMFFGCTGLTSLPENLLPATTLTTGCYRYMFKSCTGLTTLPENLLPATTLVSVCYFHMFYNCTELTNIGNIDANWFSSKNSKQQAGMFTNDTKIATPITYADIPTGWK
jgi:hypothetical protein